MIEFLQNHQKLATVAVILIAVGVVILLFILSGSNPSPVGTSGYQPVVAHGQSGPVIEGAASAAPTGIRSADFASMLATELADGQSLDDPIYIDLNGDGAEEALLIARGAGDSRPLDWFVFGVTDGKTDKLFERTRVAQGQVTVQGPMLIETEGVYNTGDEACCPSETKRTFYVWKGDGLVVSKIEAAPPGAAT